MNSIKGVSLCSLQRANVCLVVLVCATCPVIAWRGIAADHIVAFSSAAESFSVFPDNLREVARARGWAARQAEIFVVVVFVDLVVPGLQSSGRVHVDLLRCSSSRAPPHRQVLALAECLQVSGMVHPTLRSQVFCPSLCIVGEVRVKVERIGAMEGTVLIVLFQLTQLEVEVSALL